MANFTAPDGTKFTDRSEFRKYVFLTQYTFKDKVGECLKRLPGDIGGQPFDLTSLTECEVLLLDHSEAVQADDLKGCKIFIAACADSLFVRDCSDCIFTVACKQLRTRNCHRCVFHLYSKTEPIIEMSSEISFAPFNGAYKGHAKHLEEANLTSPNLWFGVFDFNDEATTGKNWRILEPAEEGRPWLPLGDCAKIDVPRTKPGSIPLPSKGPGGAVAGAEATGGAGIGAGGGATMSFSIDTDAYAAAAA
ncbi:unnamed protein product, partial [Choristocarpus tenellus]